MAEGRLIVGMLRGTTNEMLTYDLNPEESRERTDEGMELILRAWKEPQPFGSATCRCGPSRCSSRCRRCTRSAPAARPATSRRATISAWAVVRPVRCHGQGNRLLQGAVRAPRLAEAGSVLLPGNYRHPDPQLSAGSAICRTAARVWPPRERVRKSASRLKLAFEPLLRGRFEKDRQNAVDLYTAQRRIAANGKQG